MLILLALYRVDVAAEYAITLRRRVARQMPWLVEQSVKSHCVKLKADELVDAVGFMTWLYGR